MRFLIGVLVAVAAFGSLSSTASLEHEPALKSVKNTVATAVKAVTTALFGINAVVNSAILENLYNYTEIREYSTEGQSFVAVSLANIAITIFNDTKQKAEAKGILTPEVAKLLDCIAAEETTVIDIVENAFTENGWCNSELAINLTLALYNTTAAVLPATSDLYDAAEDLQNCFLGDAACLAIFGSKAVAWFNNQTSGTEGTIGAGVIDVITFSKAIFGEDVPRCGKEILIPDLKTGYNTVFSNVDQCVKA